MRFYVVSSAAFRQDSIEKSCVMFPDFIQCISKAKCVFIPRPKGSGGYRDEPGIRPSSVRPSVNIFVSAQQLEFPLEYFDDTSQLCRTGHDDVSRTKLRVLALILFELSPL